MLNIGKIKLLSAIVGTSHINQKSERSLCMNEFVFRRDRDKRRDDEFNTFESFRNSLEFQCDEGDPGVLQVKGLYRRGVQGYSRLRDCIGKDPGVLPVKGLYRRGDPRVLQVKGLYRKGSRGTPGEGIVQEGGSRGTPGNGIV